MSDTVPDGGTGSPRGGWRFPDLLLVTGSALCAALFLRLLVIGAVKIPSASMEPTLLPGDVLLVSKLAYDRSFPLLPLWVSETSPIIRMPGVSSPRTGDVVVFTLPDHRRWGDAAGRTLVKRCIGGPGDTILIRRGEVSVNGRVLPRLPGETQQAAEVSGFPTRMVIPKQGEHLPLTCEALDDIRPILESEGHTVRCDRGRVLIDGLPADWYAVRDRHYFVLGDNRSGSADSRVWGTIPGTSILGRGVLIFWSWEKGIRLDRIGTMIR